MKKIDLMYATFGLDTQCRRCRECPCLKRVVTNDSSYLKCTVYGESSAESTDLAGKWTACGRFGKPLETGEHTVLHTVKGRSRKLVEVPIPGQIKMEVQQIQERQAENEKE